MFRLFGKAAIAIYFGLFLMLVGGWGYYRLAVRKAPEQPIAFPHVVHAERLGLPCLYCHAFADTSPSAGVPAVEVCMSCHSAVAVDRPQIMELRRYWEEKEPIAWERVHELPGFVFFPHKRHVKAGVDCAVCHGAVAQMERVQRVRPLEMGWCVTCHRALGASADCATCHR